MIGRRLIIIAVALLIAVQIVRNAAVDALAPLHPGAAAMFWSKHPSVEISEALTEIGRAARDRRAVDARTFAMMDDAAAKAPLAPEPFLVRGVEAQTKGDSKTAAKAFIAAQRRDPRSQAAAYFLADHYFRSGEPLMGLEETALLARLTPQAGDAVAPFIAAYAQNPSNWPQMRALFRSEQDLEDSVLSVLARDPRNANAILAIADAGHRSPASNWVHVLIDSLVTAGDYGRARQIWSSIGRANSGTDLLYDADFVAPQAPPPFNWQLTSSTVGVAEREPGKRLHAIFYGNVDGVLASELVLLAPGSYHLQMQLIGGAVHPEALHWSLRCDKSSDPISTIALDAAATHGWNFAVPANCPAQWLELSGGSSDIAQQSDVTITRLRLMRGAANA